MNHQYKKRNKVTPMLAVCVVMALAVIFWAHERYIHATATDDLSTQHNNTLDAIQSDFESQLTQSINAINLLYATPPVQGISTLYTTAEPNSVQNDPEFNVWRTQLETIFSAYLKNNRAYTQARLIFTDTGMEFVRVERVRQEVVVVPDNKYQNKQAESYVIATRALTANTLYISPISLNREYGKPTLPYTPTMRFVLPIFNADARLFAIIVLNKDLSGWFSSVQNKLASHQQVMYTDPEGYFLDHTDPSLYFSRDLSPDKTFNRVYQTTEKLSSSLSIVVPSADEQQYFYQSTRDIFIPSAVSPYTVSVSLLSAPDAINSHKYDRRNFFILTTGLSLAVFLMAVILLNRIASRNQKLAEARAEAQAVVSGARDPIFVLDGNNFVTSCNFSAERMLSVDKHLLIGDSLNAYFNPHASVSAEELLHDPAKDIDFIWQKNSLKRYFRCTKSTIKLSDNASAVVLNLRDVTREVEEKEAANNLNALLEDKIAKRTEELELARNEALAHSKLKSQFISNISHEMRTPLNGILGALAMLRRQYLPDDTAKFVNIAEVSATNLNVLINDVLDLSKIEAGKLDLNTKLFNPTTLINDQVSTHAVKAIEKGLEFYLDTSALRLRQFKSDPHRIAQVLNNIINNAIKFTEKGVVTITAGSSISDQDATLKLTVTDTGIGITKSQMPLLFNAFEQGNSKIAARYGGTGLGLLISKQLVEMLGGEITLKSEDNRGTQVVVTFKCQQWECYDDDEFNRLSNQRIGVLCPSPHGVECIQNMINSLGGSAVIMDDDGPLNVENTPPTIIVDAENEHVKQLASKLKLTGSATRLFVLRSYNNQFDVDYSPVTYLNKPLLRTEFLAKIVNERSLTTDLVSDFHHRRQTDFDAHHLQNIGELQNQSILIVDDNDINLEVASSLLSDLPITIHLANSGEQAIEMLRAFTRDHVTINTILMDCNMPGIDGYKATQLIRKGEAGELHTDIPIIAMTANALLGERETCLRCGMNDYITKPLDPREFVTKTVEWLRKTIPLDTHFKTVSSTEEDSMNIETAELAESMPIWDKSSALSRLMNNEQLLNKLVTLFLESADNTFNSLTEAVVTKEFESIRQLSHKFKGQTGELGATKLHASMTLLEQMAKEHHADIDDVYAKVKLEFNELLVCLRDHHKR